MKSSESKITIFVVALLLTVPWAVAAVGTRPSTVENRPLRAAPQLNGASLADATFFGELDAFILDHMPLRQTMAEGYTATLTALTGASPVTGVFMGTDGTLFLSQDFLSPCSFEYAPSEIGDAVRRWNEAAAGRGRTLTVTVAPDKAAIRPDLFATRAGLATACADDKRTAMEREMESDGFLPMWDSLRNRQTGADDSLYYKFDSHWTFRGAQVFAGDLVESLRPGVWSDDLVVEGATFEVRSDIARRLGWLRVEPRPELSSERPNVTTTRSEVDVGGTRTVREYRSQSLSAPMIEGSTVVLHDSMMNFAESQIVPYFEHITFVHWDDVAAADFYERVQESDHVVIEVVERSLHLQAKPFFLNPTVAEAMTASLSAPRSGG